MLKSLYKLRHTLHAHAELSANETKTARIIQTFLKQNTSAKIINHIAGNGLAAVFKFSTKGRLILIRCELDALPIRETNPLPYASRQNNVSHKCGHDGHMAIVCGLALWLEQNAPKHGSVVLLFQPAEETGAGAEQVLADPAFQSMTPDYVFALHNLPGFRENSIILGGNPFCPVVQSIAVKFNGKQSHAAEPEKGSNPAVAFADLIHRAKNLEVPQKEDPGFTIITPVYINMGSTDYGISPGSGEVHFTLRSRSQQKFENVVQQIEQTVTAIAVEQGLKTDISRSDYFPMVINDSTASATVEQVAASLNFPVLKAAHGLNFGEDFGWYTQKFPSVLFGLGAGLDTAPLHSPDYDFPDRLIESGIKMFAGIIKQFLK